MNSVLTAGPRGPAIKCRDDVKEQAEQVRQQLESITGECKTALGGL
jgi:hypothetical protein